MKFGNIIKISVLRKCGILIFGILANFLFFSFALAQEQVYVCPLATKMEEINPRCDCRIDLILWQTVTSSCEKDGKTYEMTLIIQEIDGQQYFAILGFENGGAGVNLKPEAKISGDFSGVVGQNLNFSGENSFDPNGDPLDYLWDFGDGSFAKGVNVAHAYNSPGTYFLTLTVDDGLTSSSETATVSISSMPLPGGFVVLLPAQEKPKEEWPKEEIKKETKFLAPPTPKISFKLPIEKEKVEEKDKTGTGAELKGSETKEEIEIKKPSIEKKALKASLVDVLKGKLLIYSISVTVLVLLIVGILKLKNFWQKRKFK